MRGWRVSASMAMATCSPCRNGGEWTETRSSSERHRAATAAAAQAAIEHKLADLHHRLGDWELAEAHLAVVTELVTGTDPGRLARMASASAGLARPDAAADIAAEVVAASRRALGREADDSPAARPPRRGSA